MKQYKIINAYQFIESLSNNDKFSCDILWELFQLKKKLQPHVDFFNERTEAIRTKYIPLADENGQLTGEPLQDYVTELNELNAMEKDIDIEKFTVKLGDIPGLTLKMMESLEDFIDFEK